MISRVQGNALVAAKRLLAGRRGPVAVIDRAVEAVEEALVPSYRSQLPLLTAELYRARRYRRPLSVVVTGRQSDHLPEPLERLISENGRGEGQLMIRTTQMLSFAFGLILEEALRESDLLAYSPADDRFVLLLVESNRSEAQDMIRRLDALLKRRLQLHLKAGIAEFPVDGPTLEELVASASAAVTGLSSNGNTPKLAKNTP